MHTIDQSAATPGPDPVSAALLPCAPVRFCGVACSFNVDGAAPELAGAAGFSSGVTSSIGIAVTCTGCVGARNKRAKINKTTPCAATLAEITRTQCRRAFRSPKAVASPSFGNVPPLVEPIVDQ